MKSKTTIIVVLMILVVGGYLLMSKKSDAPTIKETPASTTTSENVIKAEVKSEVKSDSSVKEFSMTAYYDAKGKWYSLKEISVKKGDKVKIKITNTSGMHDFVINELNIKKELPMNEEVIVEFTADKVGSFVYYCSKPGHRLAGQWGTLNVTN